MASLANKVAIITAQPRVGNFNPGASSGIGAGVARHFAALRCKLALVGRNVDNLQHTVEDCVSAGLSKDQILSVEAELTNDEQLQSVVDKCMQKFGRIDVLVNAAGILQGKSTEQISMEEFDHEMRVNLRAPVLLSKLALPQLLESKGSIVNISSVTGLRAFPNVIAYCVSKAALDQFTRCLALEVAARGVRVNAVNPGVIVTDIHKRSGMPDEKYEKFLEHSKTTHAMGRVGTVEEVAKAVAFLASDDASFTTGMTLSVDGGRGITAPR